MAEVHTLNIKTAQRTQLLDVTIQIEQIVAKSGVQTGVCYVYVPHTTAAVTINEHADPDVAWDVEGAFDRLVPNHQLFRHSEGNSDSHIKAILVGATVTLFVQDGALNLGRWQGIFFCEFDGPRDRRLQVKVTADPR